MVRYYWLMLAEGHLTRPVVQEHGGADRWRWRPGSRRAMKPAKSGDQDVGVGDAFVEITEKTQFPGFGFPGGRNLALGRGKRRLPEKKLRFGGSTLGGL